MEKPSVISSYTDAEYTPKQIASNNTLSEKIPFKDTMENFPFFSEQETPKTRPDNIHNKLVPEFPLDRTIDINLIMSFYNDNLVYSAKDLGDAEQKIVQMLIQYDENGIVTSRQMILGCGNKTLEEEAWRVTNGIKKVNALKKGGIGFPIVFRK